MSEDEIERRLREAFAAQARASVGDDRPVPPPRFATEPARSRRSRLRLLAPLAAAAAVVAVVGGILAVTGQGSGGTGGRPAAGGSATVGVSGSAAPHSAGPATPSSRPATSAGRRPVHVRLFNADGARYGVGMPVIAIFSARITDARPFVRATHLLVNGKPLAASWYFEQSAAGLGAMEAHLRPRNFWPAHAKVTLSLKTRGQSAGAGLAFDDSLTLTFTTGARTVATVDDARSELSVVTDGKPVGPFPVSLGSAKTPTTTGTKVILNKKSPKCLTGPGFQECGIKYAQQLTYSGEYLLAAPWSVTSIQRRVDTSNGCTNLLPEDAKTLYGVLNVGDVVRYSGTSGPAMTMGDGVADWDVPWSTWTKGGLLPTS